MYMQIQRKENELDRMKNVISTKEQEVAQLKLKGIVIIKIYVFPM